MSVIPKEYHAAFATALLSYVMGFLLTIINPMLAAVTPFAIIGGLCLGSYLNNRDKVKNSKI